MADRRCVEVLINVLPGEVRAAWVGDGRLADLAVLRTAPAAIVGNIYLGRVRGVEHALNAAFVDIGEGSAAFLTVADARTGPAPGDRQARIAELVHEGVAIAVRVTRDAVVDKGPRATRRLALTGPRLVLTPGETGVSVSRRIPQAVERHRLTELVEELAGHGQGFVVRTAAVAAEPDSIVREAEALRNAWQEIAERQRTLAESGEAPAVLHREPAQVPALLRDRAGAAGRVLIDHAGTFAEARAWAERAWPELAERLEPYSEGRPLFAAHGIDDEIEQALAAEVPLPSGGRIVIETTRALTAIDVDSGSARGRLGDINLEALAEAAQQMRLRNLAGQIVIDVIDRGHRRERMLEVLRAAVADDWAETHVLGTSRLGLIECTRRRRSPPLAEMLLERTEDGGLRKTGATLAFEAVRNALGEVRANPGRAPVIVADARLVAALETGGEAAGARAYLAERAGAAVELREGKGLPSQGFEIVFE